MRDMRLVLASASPRRADLLRAAGLAFDVDPADIDERRGGDEAPSAFVRRLAREKAAVVAARWPGRPVLAADTVVVVAGAEVLGKPDGAADADRMLSRLAGADHEVLTGVCLHVAGTDAWHEIVERTRVWFAPMTALERSWYVATGEPADKAGGYAIQGLGSRFVTRIEGSYSNVVGLPVAQVYELCTAAGLLVS